MEHDQRKDQQLKHIISHLSLERRPTERLRHLGHVWEVFLQLELHSLRSKHLATTPPGSLLPPPEKGKPTLMQTQKQREVPGELFCKVTWDTLWPLIRLHGHTLGLGTSVLCTVNQPSRGIYWALYELGLFQVQRKKKSNYNWLKHKIH